MGMTKANTKNFYLTLYAGELQTVTILKRNDDQKEGTVTAYKVFNCRKSRIIKDGEPIDGSEASRSRTQWHLPVTELNRVGINYINALDRIVDTESGPPRYWQPESSSVNELKLFENWVTVDTVQTNPPH